MASSNLPLAQIVAAYNRIATELGETIVNRFADRNAAERRLSEITSRFEAAQPETFANAIAPTVIAPALANGATGKDSVHSRRSLEQQKGHTTPVEGQAVASTGIINRAGRVVPKAHPELRAALKAAAKAAEGSRLLPVGMASFDDFLKGFAVGSDRNTVIQFTVVGTDKLVSLRIMVDGTWDIA